MRILLFAFVVFSAIPLPSTERPISPPLSPNAAFPQDNRSQTKADADLKELTKGWPEQKKKELQKILDGTDPESRAIVIQEMLRERREALTIETVLVKWRPGNQGLVVINDEPSGALRKGLTLSDLVTLRNLKLKGTLDVVGRGSDGTAKRRVRVIIVMQHQLEQAFKFSIPSVGTVICLQLNREWKLYPVDYQKSKKTFELVKDSEMATFLVKDDAGGISSRTAFIWENAR